MISHSPISRSQYLFKNLKNLLTITQTGNVTNNKYS